MKWTASQGWSIYKYGTFGVKVSVIDLRKIADKNGYVKFVIDGKAYLFKNAEDGSNRVSGMKSVSYFFEGIDEIRCEFDSKRKAIIIRRGGRKLRTMRHRDILEKVKSKKKPDKKEQYFLNRMGLHENEYEYKGRGTGYDFLIKGSKVGRIGRFVEVKGIVNKKHVIMLTKNEYNFAKSHKKDYVLYLIESRGTRKTMYKVRFGKLHHPADAYRFQFREYEMDSFEII